jgi:predicted DNA-binding transcriptional regulator YafY
MDRSNYTQGFIHWERSPEIKGIRYFEPIVRAIEHSLVLRITYLPYYEDKPYFNEVHPYLLKEFRHRWYLIGFNAYREQVRTYALDRIRNLEELKDREYRPAGFREEEYFKYAIGIISPEGRPPLIKLAVQKNQAQYLITQPWHESQNIEEETEEQVVFSFRVHPTYEFRSLVLSLGKDGSILEPASLQKEMKQELEQMLKQY